MASTNANKSTSATPAPRRKSIKTKIVTLKLTPNNLRKVAGVSLKEESPSKNSSSADSNSQPVAASSNGDTKAPETTAADTPTADGTPTPSLMPPPSGEIKKRTNKRVSGPPVFGPDGVRIRGKPGPKKKARLEDGSIDHSNTAPRAAPGTAHKLGPKANQGAINAGLRALDRSGKPCRKWTKGGFNIKSFTGYGWALPRWTAPPKVATIGISEESGSGDSSKENKDSSQVESEKSNTGADVEMAGVTNQSDTSTPTPAIAVSTDTAPPVITSAA